MSHARTSHVGIMKRISEFIRPEHGRSLLLYADSDTYLQMTDSSNQSITSNLVASGVDGIIISRKARARQTNLFLGKKAPALLIDIEWKEIAATERADSTNMGSQMMNEIVQDIFRTGASAAVASFNVGHEKDEDEASNFALVSKLISECDELALPSLIKAIPIGERVTKETYVDCLGLAARMASEAGASCVAIPYPGSRDSTKKLIDVIPIPTFLLELRQRLSRGQPECWMEELLSTAISAGTAGVILLAPKEAAEVDIIRRAVELIHEA